MKFVSSADRLARFIKRHLQVLAVSLTFLPVALPVLLPADAHAQEFRATITGMVTDTTGASIPNAAIIVTESSTGTINRTTSDSAGQIQRPLPAARRLPH